MTEAIEGDNRHRRENGLPAVRIRVGIHTGPAMVGNVGAPGRINYTLVGDVVNMAQRIEEVAKEGMKCDEEAVVLVSDVVVRRVGTVWSAEPVGRHILRGRHEATAIYRLR